jgi:putative FmdB family regulatory protein
MPIYEYRCNSCGAQDDVMQKMSEAPLTKCPACGKETYAKQLSAAGFQLKGNGYYVTDFKNKPEPSCSTSACAACPAASTSESKAA